MRTTLISCALLLALPASYACDRAPDRAPDRVLDRALGEAGSAGATPLARCGIDGPAGLTGDGVGALRLGATVEQVTLACRVLSDTTDPQGPEGQPERSLTVLLGEGSDTLRAVVVGDSIWRLHVTSEWPRALDSLGVGSVVADLRVRRGARLINGEGRLFITTADPCGLSFRLDRPNTTQGLTLGAVGDSVKVVEVLVVGCR